MILGYGEDPDRQRRTRRLRGAIWSGRGVVLPHRLHDELPDPDPAPPAGRQPDGGRGGRHPPPLFNQPGQRLLKWWYAEIRFARALARTEQRYLARELDVELTNVQDCYLGEDGIVGCWGEDWPEAAYNGWPLLQVLHRLAPAWVRTWPLGARCPHPEDDSLGRCPLGRSLCGEGTALCAAEEPWLYVDPRSTAAAWELRWRREGRALPLHHRTDRQPL